MASNLENSFAEESEEKPVESLETLSTQDLDTLFGEDTEESIPDTPSPSVSPVKEADTLEMSSFTPLTIYDQALINDFYVIHKNAESLFSDFKKKTVTDYVKRIEPKANVFIIQSLLNLASKAFMDKHTYQQSVALGFIGINPEIIDNFKNKKNMADFLSNIVPGKILFNSTHNKLNLELQNTFIIIEADILIPPNTDNSPIFVILHNAVKQDLTRLNVIVCANFIQTVIFANNYVLVKNSLGKYGDIRKTYEASFNKLFKHRITLSKISNELPITSTNTFFFNASSKEKPIQLKRKTNFNFEKIKKLKYDDDDVQCLNEHL
ncbi:unnamed protein product [Rotaria socialis]|uniref:Uncharacterized protein n=1 Tax=Rotaria socialis TaxID=392032 RepID=A0A821WP53_9BILA|nr:unnamed protein product [Rotaria socialis]CAF4930769.1 unnamed protein product [Rotaria socialis]